MMAGRSIPPDGLAGSGRAAGHPERRGRRGDPRPRGRRGAALVQGARLPGAESHLAPRGRPGHRHTQRGLAEAQR